MGFLKIKLFTLIFAVLFTSPAFATPCNDLFSPSPENQIFRIMERKKDNYVEFSLSPLGQPQVRALSILNAQEVLNDSLVQPALAPTAGEEAVYKTSYIFDILRKYGHEAIYFFRDENTGLKSVVAIHSTVLSEKLFDGGGLAEGRLRPELGAVRKKLAAGGTRIWNYRTEGEGLLDVVRLSEGMSHKAAVASVPLGGGKAVIFGPPELKTKEFLKTYGLYLRILDEQSKNTHSFVTGEDVGMKPEDLPIIGQTGKHRVVGLVEKSGDPSILTAVGVVAGIKASLKWALGEDRLKGRELSVQGLGNVGSRVAQQLARAGAKVNAYDIDSKKAKCLSQKFGLNIVTGKKILQGACDVFVPCALGAVVNVQTAKKFQCKVIAGSANNQLEGPEYGKTLKDMGILYAPDYVINAGGLISVSREVFDMNQKEGEKWAKEKTKDIYNTLMHIFKIAEKENISTAEAADQLARQRIQEARSIQKALSKAARTRTSNEMPVK